MNLAQLFDYWMKRLIALRVKIMNILFCSPYGFLHTEPNRLFEPGLARCPATVIASHTCTAKIVMSFRIGALRNYLQLFLRSVAWHQQHKRATQQAMTGISAGDQIIFSCWWRSVQNTNAPPFPGTIASAILPALFRFLEIRRLFLWLFSVFTSNSD